MTADQEPRWYIVYTKAQQEWLANEQLKQQGYETFYPHEMRTVRLHGRVDGVVRPYLPRYLFVGLYDGQPINPIRNTIGVSTMLFLAGEYLRVPAQVINDLKSRCDESGRLFTRPKPESKRRPGDKIKIAAGPLEGFLGEISRVDGSDSIRVWVDMFGRKVEALISESEIAA